MEYFYLPAAIFVFVIGLCIGSFLNVVIYRLPAKESVAKGRSHCPGCGAMIRAYDNIPVISFLILRGKCRDCGMNISARYPAIELLTAFCFEAVWLVCGLSWATPIYLIMSAVLICVSFIDIDTREIPDRFHIILAALAVAAAFLLPTPLWWERLIGAAVISVPMLLISFFTGGFGFGDVKLMAACGALLGWKLTLLAGVIGVVAAGIFGIVLIAGKKAGRKTKIAFGPWLCAGVFVAALFGDALISAYLGLFML